MGYVSSNERRYVPYKIAALVEVMYELGHSTQDVLKDSGVEEHTLEDPAALTSIRQYDIACRNALTLTDRLDIPFLVGRKLHLSAYGMYGYALMSSTSLREFFKLGIKYHDLATPTLTIGWSEDCDSAKSYVIDAGTGRSSDLQNSSSLSSLPSRLPRFTMWPQIASPSRHVSPLQPRRTLTSMPSIWAALAISSSPGQNSTIPWQCFARDYSFLIR
jgi:hypothetical protein